MSAPHHHVDPAVCTTAIGALDAQRVIDDIQAGRSSPEHAWLLVAETAIAHGWKSGAVRSIVVELAKRLRRPPGG